MNRIAGWVGALFLGAGLVACGSTVEPPPEAAAGSGGAVGTTEPAGSGGGTGGATDPARAFTDFSTAVCNLLDECEPIFFQSVYGDVATCIRRYAVQTSLYAADPGTTATPALLEGCAKALTGLSCAEGISPNGPAACNSVPGTQADGTACGDDGQCSGGFCKRTTDPSCGVCAKRVGLGEACSADCEFGLVCASGMCAEIVAAGGACDATHPCQSVLSCIGGVCSTPLAAGAACQAITDCDLDKGYFCDGTKTCQPLGLAKIGEACGMVGNGIVLCLAGSCTAPSPNMGTCVAFIADGGACDPTQIQGCTPPANCVNNVCALPNPASCK
jgi:hypothetical protein